MSPDGERQERAMKAIEVQGLKKAYGGVEAVGDVSFAVAEGEIFGILGPNGAGKSTTVECLVGLRRRDAGEVMILGLDPAREAEQVHELVGVQLQSGQLPPRMRVGEAMELYAAFYRDPADPAELLARLGLAGHERKAYAKLSGGQQQRLSIALALIGRPKVAVLDELTTGLDPGARRETWGLIEDLRDSGVTVLLVTHFMDEAERLCDRVAIVAEGRVVGEGAPRALAEAVPTERRMIPDRPSLEDAFIALTERRPALTA